MAIEAAGRGAPVFQSSAFDKGYCLSQISSFPGFECHESLQGLAYDIQTSASPKTWSIVAMISASVLANGPLTDQAPPACRRYVWGPAFGTVNASASGRWGSSGAQHLPAEGRHLEMAWGKSVGALAIGSWRYQRLLGR